MADFMITRLPAAEWAFNNPTLQLNEVGVETDLRNNVNIDTGKAKLGDGATAWNSLGYWSPSNDSFSSVTGSPSDNAALNRSLRWFGVPALMPDNEIVRVRTAILTGENDIYTPPAGNKAMIMHGIMYINTGSVTNTPQIKTGGSYYRIAANGTAVTALSSVWFPPQHILGAGEYLAINSGGNMNGIFMFLEFPDTVPLFTRRLNALTIAQQDLYEVPAGKRAMTLPRLEPHPGLFQGGASTAAPAVINDSGAAATITANLVPDAGVIGVTNQIYTNSLANGGTLGLAFPSILATGERIVISSSTDTAGQSAFINVFEFDA